MFGSHLSIAGCMAGALRRAEALRLDCVQVFTKNQQQWRVAPLRTEAVEEWRAEARRLGWDAGAPRTVAHASYLINLASGDDNLWRLSVDLMVEEVERCERLGIPLLVHHPGAHKGGTREAGLLRIAEAYREILGRTAGYRTVLCLENTVGCGTILGREFEELAGLRGFIAERTGAEGRVGYCFDTCHAHAGGHDLSSRAAAEATLARLGRVCGFEHVRVLHLNDSKGTLGSRLDRHEHVGKGTIGPEGFAAVVNHPAFRDRPKIMETPKGTTPAGVDLDTLNLRRLRRLVEAGGATVRPRKLAVPA
ncbi:MAG TPA: deoxyribonuclease IV [Phycisphaerales bacterium]|nr:deoxyribonuclease IV [Phycisphaerales bacterium]